VWSVAVLNMPNIGFRYSENQLFWLAALPALSGATLRIFYSFMVPVFGGRKWTALSTASLLIPAIGIGFAVQDPNTSYATMAGLALLCGFGGGNFSSSMANISFFFPKAEKGTALGLNAGLGNLGVSVVQFVVPGHTNAPSELVSAASPNSAPSHRRLFRYTNGAGMNSPPCFVQL
jgi:NNP family nitrate/nitrite transporter-like MFS transporter